MLRDFSPSLGLSITKIDHNVTHGLTDDFVVVSSDLHWYVLDTWVKRGAEQTCSEDELGTEGLLPGDPPPREDLLGGGWEHGLPSGPCSDPQWQNLLATAAVVKTSANQDEGI